MKLLVLVFLCLIQLSERSFAKNPSKGIEVVGLVREGQSDVHLRAMFENNLLKEEFDVTPVYKIVVVDRKGKALESRSLNFVDIMMIGDCIPNAPPECYEAEHYKKFYIVMKHNLKAKVIKLFKGNSLIAETNIAFKGKN